MSAAEADSWRFDVFLSHNSRDNAIVERIAERLKRERVEPWLDAWNLVPGADWQRGIADGLAASRSCAVFVGSADLGAWANEEVAVALDRAASNPEFRLFLVLLPGLPERYDAAGLLPFLRMRTWVDYRRGLDDERAFQALLGAINGLPLGPAVPIATDADICPYRGLEAFEEEHADFFFGRDADVQRLLEKLKGTRFLAVLGASGSGKSSLVRAGLVPALRREAPEGVGAWAIVTMRPGARPLEALAAQLLRVGGDTSMHQTLDALVADPRTLHLAASLALADRPSQARLLLVVDQFEEVFTLCCDERERTAFFANLLYAGTIPDGRCGVLLAMRADFYHRCGAYPELAQQLVANQYLVSPLQPDGLRQAVEEPARRVGLAFEPGLAATILEDVSAQPGALPLLEHALLELWRRRVGGLLTLAGYRESGGAQGATSKRAEEVFQSLDPDQQWLARRVLLRLTEPGEGTEDTRRRAHLAELQSGAAGPDVAAVIARLVDARLVTTSRDETAGGEVVEVAHEALIRSWPRLRAWIDEDRAGLRVHRRLAEAAQEWERLGRDDSALYRGARLAEAREWRDTNEPSLNDLERKFLAASRAAEQDELEQARRRTRRFRALALALAVLLAAVAGAALYAKRQADDAREAESRALAAQAVATADANPLAALDLAVRAAKAARTPDAESALRVALASEPLRSTLSGATAKFSSDGKLVLTTGDGDSMRPARIWNAATGRAVRTLGGNTYGAAFSPDGKRVVTVGGGGGATIWDTASGRRLHVLRGRSHPLWYVAFSPDGKLVITDSQDGTAGIYSVANGRRLHTLRGHTGSAASPEFSPDGTLVVTSGDFGNAWIWNAASGRRIHAISSHRDEFSDIDFSPDGKRVFTAGVGPTRIWETASGRLLQTLRPGDVGDIAFSPDGKLFVTAGGATAGIWNAASGRRVNTLRGHTDNILSAAFSPDGSLIATAGADATARIWDTAGGTLLQTLSGHTSNVWSAAFGPSGDLVLTASQDGTARLWDTIRTRTPLRNLRGHARYASSAVFSPDGKLVFSASDDRTVRIWDTATGRSLHTLRGHRRRIISIGASPDGKTVFTTSSDGTARIWDTASGRLLHSIGGHSKGIKTIALSSDLERALTADTNGTAQIVDIATGRTLTTLNTHNDHIQSAVFSPDGKRLLTTDSDRARLWDTKSGRVLSGLGESGSVSQSGNVSRRVFSPNGRLVLSTGYDTVQISDTTSGHTLHTLRGHSAGVTGAVFSPDGKLVLSAGGLDLTARIWDVSTGRARQILRPGYVSSADFSTDGSLVVTTGDRTIVWDTATGHSLRRFETSGPAEFSPDANLVLTTGYDGTARIWGCDICAEPVEQLLSRAKKRLAAP